VPCCTFCPCLNVQAIIAPPHITRTCRLGRVRKTALQLFKTRLIQPDAPLYCNWCLGMILPMVHTAVATPCASTWPGRPCSKRSQGTAVHCGSFVCRYYVGMMKEPKLVGFIIDRLVDLFFMVDMVISFMLSYRSSATGGVPADLISTKRLSLHSPDALVST
jgi:hypothetical protein